MIYTHTNLNKDGRPHPTYGTYGQVGCSDRLVSALQKVQVVRVCVYVCMCVCVCVTLATRKATR